MGKPVLLWEACYSLGKNKIKKLRGLYEKDWHTTGRSCLFWSSVFATVCPLKNLLNFCHFDDVILNLYIYIYTFLTKYIYISFFLSVFFFVSFFFFFSYYLFFLHLTKKIFCWKRLCFLVFRRIGEYISLVLSVLSASPVVVHSFLTHTQKKFFHIHEITWVVHCSSCVVY